MNTNESNAPKLLLDEHIWVYLATLLREQGFDVVHVCEDGLEGKPDNEILRVASEKHRAVVTFNIKDFIPLAIQYFEGGKVHYGVVVSNQISQGELQRRVTNLLNNLSADDLKNTVRFLQDYK
jgi:predicted nuclease of predicted toxin-antitoxin system